MRFLLRAVTTALVLTAPVVAAHATPVTYTLSGTMSGTIGTTTFTDALTTFTVIGDTDNIVPFMTVGLANPGSGTVNIANIGTATLTGETFAFFFPISGSLAGAGIGDFTSGTSVGARSGSLLGYDLSTFIGPITGDNISAGGDPVGTSAGDLDITEIGSFSTFTASASPVPEPSSLALMGTGIFGLVGVAKRKLFA